jgi:hypothetical protein
LFARFLFELEIKKSVGGMADDLLGIFHEEDFVLPALHELVVSPHAAYGGKSGAS